MDNKNIIIAQADGAFPFQFYIEKALSVDVANPDAEDSYQIVGIASTPNIDHDMERMAVPALHRMARKINSEGVPLRVEHQKNENAIIGKINEAWVDDSNKLWIKAKLDKANVAAQMLHNALKSGAKLGLSVGGRVTQAIREMSEGQGKMIKTFFDVIVDEVSVTPRPSNYESWLLNKHIIQPGDNADSLYNTPLHNTFLTENPKFDYLMAIEKSIPKDAWKKVDTQSNLNKDMNKNTTEMETEKAGTPTESEVPAHLKSPVEVYATKAFVEEKFNAIASLFKSEFKKFTQTDADGKTREMDAPAAIDQPADDQHNPTDEKETNPAQVRTVKSGANGSDENGQREKKPGTDAIAPADQTAHDADNDTEVKEENPAQVRTVKTAQVAAKLKKAESTTTPKMETEKAEATETTETMAAQKADPALDESERTATAGNETEDIGKEEETASPTRDDYNLPETKMKSRTIPTLDAFSALIGQFIDKAEQRMTKSGTRVPGLRRMLLDTVQNDPEIQKSIQSMLREPGLKKSVVGGQPVTWTKDGVRMKLVPDSVATTITKSVISKDAKFGDVYKANFSSSQDAGLQSY